MHVKFLARLVSIYIQKMVKGGPEEVGPWLGKLPAAARREVIAAIRGTKVQV